MIIKSVAAMAGVALGALTLAACAPPHPHHPHADPLRAITRLDCPQDEGDLTRQSAAADGQSCLYADTGGALVTLQLVPLNGQDPKDVLAALKTQLKSEMPASGPVATTERDKVDVNLPGLHIQASGDDKSGGGDHGSANVATGPHGGISVHADDQGAEFQLDEGGSGIRLTYFITADAAGPHGFKLAGFQARGPASGPLAVASVKSKDSEHDDLFHDMAALLKHNVGG